jgi:hypothetical protein
MGTRQVSYLLLLAWLPPLAAVGITLWATQSVPSQGGTIPPSASTTIGMALILGGVLSLLGAALGLRNASVVRRSGQGAAMWPYLIVVPVGLMMIVIWKLFFAAA